ncbi:DUF302 domain-containing protein [Bradyrhizobium sp. Pear77]|uniref:DUF302 domain-containing protein n=1 Tax=Bradyrhizobium altum TaxID=1571202 RepID=UPI001E28C28A|nr:DUF302 domain-containing protein [Bradyrhizobium altum]MCC8955380.1 DUF302 domain-containing protein [Bradyrhizobium altum]
MTITKVASVAALAMHCVTASADDGLVTKPSKYSVKETIDNFEAAINAQAARGWVVFDRIDHAAAAKNAGLDMRPRTVIIFGNPKAGTFAMTKSSTLAIDLPMKVLVWQDDQDRVWLTYNTSEYNAKYVLPRHGLAASDNASKDLETFLTKVTDLSTQ